MLEPRNRVDWMRKLLATLCAFLLVAWTVSATHCLEEDLHDHQEVSTDHDHDHDHDHHGDHSHPHRDGGKHEHACSCLHHVPGEAGRWGSGPVRIQPSQRNLAESTDWLLPGFPEDLLRPPRA